MTSKVWGKRKCVQKKKLIDKSCESNVRTVIEEHFSSENKVSCRTLQICCFRASLVEGHISIDLPFIINKSLRHLFTETATNRVNKIIKYSNKIIKYGQMCQMMQSLTKKPKVR